MEPIKDILSFEINPASGDTGREIRSEKHLEHLYLQFKGMHFNFPFSFVEVRSADPDPYLSGSLSQTGSYTGSLSQIGSNTGSLSQTG